MMNEKRRKWELEAFRAIMWAIVVCSFIAIATKAVFGRPSASPFHYLLIIAIVASLLIILVPNLESYIISRVSEISFGGVKLVIAQVETARVLLDYDERSPESYSDSNPSLYVNEPFPVRKLTGFQLYQYERLSFKLYQSFDQIKEPNNLEPAIRENYRKLILRVGRAAFAMKHFTKYLDIISHLQSFKDRDLNSEELFLLGHAYLWAADEQLELSKRKDYWEASRPFLTTAMEKNPSEVRIPFSLGVALLSLGDYQQGMNLIQQGMGHMETCIGLHQPIIPWAKWNIACGLKKQDKDEDALKKLEEIPPGPWWDGIETDGWFVDPENAAFEQAFKTLCEAKKAAYRAVKPS